MSKRTWMTEDEYRAYLRRLVDTLYVGNLAMAARDLGVHRPNLHQTIAGKIAPSPAIIAATGHEWVLQPIDKGADNV